MYFSPYIDSSGYHYPAYNDILANLIDSMQTIYGTGIYLGVDSQDYQILAIFAEKVFDCFQAVEIAYNARSPVTAIGTALDMVCAINGITRKAATSSVAEVVLTGESGTTITNGYVADDVGRLWDLPASVVIGADGTVTTVAVCRTPGAYQAAIGTINKIMTPTAGWETVTNPTAADIGTDTETDASLRSRQASGVSIPAQSVTAGLRAALSAIEGIGRTRVYENDTGSTDANSIPAHSVCCVVEDGVAQDIADTIFRYKTIGCGTYGSQTVSVTDEYGNAHSVKYSPLSEVSCDVTVNISGRAGYSSSSIDLIKQAISDYMSGFEIGEPLSLSMITMVALSVNQDVHSPTFVVNSVTAARHGQVQSTSDISAAYNEALYCETANITVTVS